MPRGPILKKTPDAQAQARSPQHAAGSVVKPPHGVLSALDAVRMVRRFLERDVALVFEFVGDQCAFRYIDAEDMAPFQACDTMSMRRGGSVPRAADEGFAAAPDTPDWDPFSMPDLPLSIAAESYLSVPLCRPDGTQFGAFCCFNHASQGSNGARDLHLMRMFGELIARQLDADSRRRHGDDGKARRIALAIERGEPRLVFQPVFRLRDGLLLGAEALARFDGAPARSPDVWFAEAKDAGLQSALEVQAIRNAVADFRDLWSLDPDLRLAVNASPETILSSEFRRAMADAPTSRIAVEITEHEKIEDYRRITAVLAHLRQNGCKIAVDDAGSGYASLRHILQLEPDVIKLDVSLVRGIDTSAGRRALASGLIEFARQTGCVIIAEGVETASELETLRAMRVNSAQGYLLGRPASKPAFADRVRAGGHSDAPILPLPPLAPG